MNLNEKMFFINKLRVLTEIQCLFDLNYNRQLCRRAALETVYTEKYFAYKIFQGVD